MIFSVYRLDTGAFTGHRLAGPTEESCTPDVPPGCGLVAGSYGMHTHRVQTDAGGALSVVPAMPVPASGDDLAREARSRRAALMSASDWVTLRAVRTGQPVPPDWAAYMQALADVPQQSGFPFEITWPTPPSP